MARRKARIPQGKKIQPAVQTLTFELEGTGTKYIDLSQCASLVNRRFYRQGLNWAVAGFTLQCYQGIQAYANISKIPNTWVSSNAWEKGFHVWRRMIDNAVDEAGTESIKPRYLDFKVYMDHSHHGGLGPVGGANLIPQDAEGNEYHLADWDMSTITIPSTGGASASDFELIFLGQNLPGPSVGSGLNAYSLIQGYADSRALPQETEPHTPDAAPNNWYLDVFDEGTLQDTVVTLNLGDDQTQPPYPVEDGDDQAAGTYATTQYPGGGYNPNGFGGRELHYPLAIRGDAVGSNSSAPGGNFPCGLIAVESGVTLVNPESGLAAKARLLVHLVPGDHKGYLCQKMQDM